MKFTPIAPERWPRAQLFYYFSKMAPTSYSLTVSLEVTALWQATHRRGVKFFPAYLWLVTQGLNRQTAFKLAEQEGVLGYYDGLTPLYAAFHPDDQTISFLWTPYRERFADFYAQYLQDQRLYGNCHGLLGQPQPPPPNAYTVSCVPWLELEHFAVHSDPGKPYYFPSVEAGRVTEREGRFWMPLSLTCHHAATDGWHIRQFLQDLEQDMALLAQTL